MALPDFFVIGPPKAGTTALHSALAAHPQLYMSRVKEPRFFLADGRPPPARGGPGDAQTYQEYVWRRSDYEALFAGAPAGALRGESSPFYLHDWAAQQRIRRLVPHARLIAVLRDPVERAHSNWAHLWSAGLEPYADFLEACAHEPERVAAGWAPFWQYVGLGRYGEQVAGLFEAFPPEQVLLLRYRQLWAEPAVALDRICTFLGVAPGLLDRIPSENVRAHVADTPFNRWVGGVLRAGAAVGHLFPPGARRAAREPLLSLLRRGGSGRPRLSAGQRRAAQGFFVDDVRRLEAVTGEDFGLWLADDDRDTRPADPALPH